MLCKRKGFDIDSASEMSSNRNVSMQLAAYLTWVATFACYINITNKKQAWRLWDFVL